MKFKSYLLAASIIHKQYNNRTIEQSIKKSYQNKNVAECFSKKMYIKGYSVWLFKYKDGAKKRKMKGNGEKGRGRGVSIIPRVD